MVPIVYLFLTSFYGGTIVAVIRVKFRAFFDFFEQVENSNHTANYAFRILESLSILCR